MHIDEQPLLLTCEGETLLAIVCSPRDASPSVGLLVVVGGPQYRAGSHRQFVQLTRGVAAGGFAAMRFDVRGMGDSTGQLRSFEQSSPDIGAAIDGLMAAAPTVTSVVLWGLCDGASAALLYLHERRDPRVSGLVLVNPWVRTTQGQARATVKHYYLTRLRDPAFWKKLFKGGVAGRAVSGLVRNLRDAAGPAPAGPAAATYTSKMASAWHDFAGPVLLALSSHDLTAREFEMHTASSGDWQKAMAKRPASMRRLEGADHTCSQPQSNQALIDATVHWLVTACADSHCYDDFPASGGA